MPSVADVAVVTSPAAAAIAATPLPPSDSKIHTWGSSTLLRADMRHQLLLLSITPDAGMAANYHLHRRKRWVVLNGLLQLELNGETRRVRAGETVEINEEVVHALHNIGKIPAEIYEVQIGEYFGDDDITLV
ncbi:MAG: cupin domain-containing protein [Pseudomonas sp.]|uniref:cupin domain-containing protein n=1 Tax=Pseudomonas sp. TaxID=306 RepID=UPI003981B574